MLQVICLRATGSSEKGTAAAWALPLFPSQRVVKKMFFAGCSKTSGCTVREILRKEAYLRVRCDDEG